VAAHKNIGKSLWLLNSSVDLEHAIAYFFARRSHKVKVARCFVQDKFLKPRAAAI